MKKSIKLISSVSLLGVMSLLVGGALLISQNLDKETSNLSSDGGVLIDEKNYEKGPMFYPASYSTSPTSEPQYSNQYSTTFLNANYTANTYNSYRGDSVKVAVIDSGIYYTHEDFSLGGNSIVQSKSRSIEYSSGWKYYQYDSNPSHLNDTLGHGSNVASVIASQLNSLGCAGIAPNVELYVYKVTNSSNGYEWTAIINALNYCIENHIDVINMSFQAYEHAVSYGGSSMGASTGCSTVLTDYLDACHDAGITLVGAAGNYNTSEPSYPASNNHVISVGSLADGSTTTKAGFSNTYGIDLVAPGYVYVADAGATDSYKETQGTSFSAPIVTAAIALYKQKYPTSTPDEIEAALKASCDPVSGNPSWAGSGRLNIGNFLNVDNCPTEIVLNCDTEIELEVGEHYQLDWTVNGRGTYSDDVEFVTVMDDVVSIDSNGYITAIGEGEEYIEIRSTVDSSVYSETITVTVTSSSALPGETCSIVPSDFGGSYPSSEGTLNSASGLPLKYKAIMKSGSVMQFQASNGLLYNNSALQLYSLVINNPAGNGTFTVCGGNSVKPTTVITESNGSYDLSGCTYFVVKNTTSNMASATSIDVILLAPNSISVSTAPTKLSYLTGEHFDPTGLVISCNYTGSSSTVTYSNSNASQFTFSPSLNTSLTPSNTSVTITYASRSTSVNITVTDPVTLSSIAISGYTTNFVEGDTFSFGGTVTATYSDSSQANVTSSTTFSGYNMTTLGNQTVTASYTYEGVTKSQDYTINVAQGALSSITLSGQTTAYNTGDTFTFTGTVTAHFANGYAKTVSPTSVSSPDMSSEGQKQITVSVTYNGVTKSANYTITVTDKVVLSSIEFEDLPTSIPYKSTVSLGSYKVKANYSDGHSTYVTNSAIVDSSSINNSALGSYPVTASYTEEGITKEVTSYVKITNNGASGNVGDSYSATDTYTLTSASWGATNNSQNANWTSGKSGTGFTTQGLQVATGASGANGTSPVSYEGVTKVIVNYSTNSSKGTGSIAVKVGSNTAISHSVSTSGGTTTRALSFEPISAQNGNVTVTITCTQNSIYVYSVEIFYSENYPASPNDQAKAWATYFLNEIKPECNSSGSGSDVDDIASKWANLSAEYGWMIAESKNEFTTSSDSTIAEARQLYGIIISKYSSHQGISNFVTDGNGAPILDDVVTTYYSPVSSETASIILIIIISLVAVTSIVGYVYINNHKKK